jgi:hypothetical protein
MTPRRRGFAAGPSLGAVALRSGYAVKSVFPRLVHSCSNGEVVSDAARVQKGFSMTNSPSATCSAVAATLVREKGRPRHAGGQARAPGGVSTDACAHKATVANKRLGVVPAGRIDAPTRAHVRRGRVRCLGPATAPAGALMRAFAHRLNRASQLVQKRAPGAPALAAAALNLTTACGTGFTHRFFTLPHTRLHSI